MDLTHLEYFCTVCEKRSISKAAQSLYMTPQGLSKILRNIEDELGTVLFLRSGSGVQLTATGEYLYSQLPDYLHGFHRIQNELRCIDQAEKHEIDLLSAYGILRLVTPECLSAFRESYPDIILRYREYPDRQVERLFLDGNGNVAFTVGNDALKHVTAVPMERFEIKLLVHHSHPLARKSAVTIADLDRQPLYIESSEFNIHKLILSRCEKAGIHPNILFEASGFSLCHKMVKKNKGITVTVDFIFDDMGDDALVMLPFADEPLYWETYMLSRKGERPTPEVDLFCRFVMNWMGKIKRNEILR